jgi:hypothetical protein
MNGAAGILLRTVFNSNVLLIRTTAVLDGQTGMSLKVYEINHFCRFDCAFYKDEAFKVGKKFLAQVFRIEIPTEVPKHKACRCILKCNSMLNIRLLLALKRTISFRISQKFVQKLAFALSGMV